MSRISKTYQGEEIFLTLTVIEWINIFTNEEYFKVLLDNLKFYQLNKKLLVFGFVFMTNHIHLIVSCKEGNLADILRDFKKMTTQQIKGLILKDRRQYILKLIKSSYSKKQGEDFQIWQRENYPEVIKSDKFFAQKLRYIHENPVKKGYVNKSEDWKYSSARNYWLNDHSLIKIAEW